MRALIGFPIFEEAGVSSSKVKPVVVYFNNRYKDSISDDRAC